MTEQQNHIEEILDHVYSHAPSALDLESYHVRVGIWDAANVPYTYYALLYCGNNLVTGEASYGEDTIDGALQVLQAAVHEGEL